MAGFSVPTQRALLMLLLYSLAASVGRSPWSWRVYAMAMGLVLVFDPRAILAPGFWFSFLAVASILLFLQGRTDRVDARGWLRLQWILSLLLLPLGIAWFQLGSWSAPLANLIAVPLVTFWVLPLLLLGSAFALVAPALGTPFILLADLGIRLLLWTLEAILKLPIAVTDSAVPGSLLLLSTLALLLLYLPAATGSLRWALLPLLPLLMPVGSGLDTGEFSLRLPDARAGQYIIVQTARHRLLFDPGPASGGSGGRPPGSVLALNQIGVRRLDGVIVSHAHRDHAGALDAVLERFPVDRLWTRQAGRSPLEEPCRAGDQWRWDGVHFEFLHPPVAWDDGPAASCVLRISGPGGSALLTGGLAGLGLAVLLRDPATAAPVDLLVLPPGTDAPQGHPLVARMQPEMVWVSGAAGAQTVPPQMAARDPAPGFRSTHADGQLRAWFRIEGRQFDSGSRHEHARFWLHRP